MLVPIETPFLYNITPPVALKVTAMWVQVLAVIALLTITPQLWPAYPTLTSPPVLTSTTKPVAVSWPLIGEKEKTELYWEPSQFNQPEKDKLLKVVAADELISI